MIDRSTSATVTFSITWSRPWTVMELTTLSAPPTSRAARSPACWASIGLATEPESITPSATPFELDVGIRQRLFQRGAHAVEISFDGNIVGSDLLAGRN